MSFLNDVIFPTDISHGSVGGPGYSTSIVSLSSGNEGRNSNWVYSRYTYDVSYGTRVISQLEALVDIFHVAEGQHHSFRYQDFFDYKSVGVESTPTALDQQLGIGDGIETDYQIIKTYANGVNSKVRNITKPISGTVLVAVDGVTQTETTHYTIDYTTGIITFITPPASTLVVTAGYEFHVPVRFNIDYLPTTIDLIDAGSTEIPLVEVRE